MKFLKQLTDYFSGRRPAGVLFITAAVALSALVAGASTYLFMGAGRSQLPAPVESEIIALARVAALPVPTPIQTPPAVEAAVPGTIATGSFLTVAVTQPARNESASAQVASSQAVVAASPVRVVTEPATVASTPEKSGDSSPTASGLITAQSDDLNINGDGHGSRENISDVSDGYKAKNTAHHNSGAKQEHNRGRGHG